MLERGRVYSHSALTINPATAPVPKLCGASLPSAELAEPVASVRAAYDASNAAARSVMSGARRRQS